MGNDTSKHQKKIRNTMETKHGSASSLMGERRRYCAQRETDRESVTQRERYRIPENRVQHQDISIILEAQVCEIVAIAFLFWFLFVFLSLCRTLFSPPMTRQGGSKGTAREKKQQQNEK